jgi:hypothetical protein
MVYLVTMVLQFPAECPPDDAVSMQGTFFRLAVRGLAVGAATTDDCWLRPYEQRNGALEGQVDNPEAHALSLYASKDDLARALNPRIARKPVAAVTLARTAGVLKHTPNAGSTSHHDWWTDPYDLIPVAVIVEAPKEVAA